MNIERPTYNSNDFIVRRAVAAGGIVKIAVDAAIKARQGSLDIAKQRLLEMAVSQFECIKNYLILETNAMGIFKPLNNTGVDATAVISVNGIVISNGFIFTSDKVTTSENIVKAIDGYTSVPEYSATVVGDEVHITAITGGASSNGYDIALVATPVGVTYEFVHFYGGQDGAQEDDNLVTEVQLEAIFSNIAEITGCGYAPLGTKYDTV